MWKTRHKIYFPNEDNQLYFDTSQCNISGYEASDYIIYYIKDLTRKNIIGRTQEFHIKVNAFEMYLLLQKHCYIYFDLSLTRAFIYNEINSKVDLIKYHNYCHIEEYDKLGLQKLPQSLISSYAKWIARILAIIVLILIASILSSQKKEGENIGQQMFPNYTQHQFQERLIKFYVVELTVNHSHFKWITSRNQTLYGEYPGIKLTFEQDMKLRLKWQEDEIVFPLLPFITIFDSTPAEYNMILEIRENNYLDYKFIKDLYTLG